VTTKSDFFVICITFYEARSLGRRGISYTNQLLQLGPCYWVSECHQVLFWTAWPCRCGHSTTRNVGNQLPVTMA